MPREIDDAVANLKKALLKIEDAKARKSVGDALRGLQKAFSRELRQLLAGEGTGVPW